MEFGQQLLGDPQGRILLMNRMRTRGFTLIELMVAVSIGVLLLVMAIPAYTRWMADAQTLNAAETVAAGLRVAYSEAIKRNTNVEFTFDKSASTRGWTVKLLDGTLIKDDTFRAGADQTVLTANPASSTTVTFNALGQREKANAAAPTVPFDYIDVSGPTGTGTRDLRVVIDPAKSGIKICDRNAPAWPSDPRGCPP